MTFVVIERPDVDFDALEHVYSIGGERVAGVSSVAKLGGAEESYSIASAWGFRVGYEGAFELYGKAQESRPWSHPDDLRAALKDAGLTPWAKRDSAVKRGNAVHDALEELAQNDTVPEVSKYPEAERGHVVSVLKWFLHFRPRFLATEVQVASRTHLFAGRYDLRVMIDSRKLAPLIDPLRQDPAASRIRGLAAIGAPALVLADLKTSKRIYPNTHYPQLSGYELAGTEMGFPATDCQMVLNTNEDGTFDPELKLNDYGEMACDVGISYSEPEDFVGLLAAYRVIKRMAAVDPDTLREKAREEVLVAHLPARSRDVVALELPELAGMDSRSIGAAFGKLAKRGKAVKGERGMWLPAEA